jgi:predicted metal-dependent phosphoesterase TrpH
MTEPRPSFDLQSHSVHSDGELSPREVVAAAAADGVELLALTDHDSAEGIEEALTAASAHGLQLVPAVEISTADGAQADLHILGYRIDHRDRALSDWLRASRASREDRAWAMADAIRELGYELDEEPLRQRERQGKSIGRPHLAAAVVSHPGNADRLAAEGLDEPSAFLVEYLIEGRPAFRARQAPSVKEAIEVIHAAGGVAVWAHPFWDIEAPDDVLATIDRFVALGLDGVECFYVTFDRPQTELLADHCEQLGLLTTGSSDFHGPGHRQFSKFRAFSTFGRTPALGLIALGATA